MTQAEYLKEWRIRNKDKVYAYSKKQRLSNREASIAATRQSYYRHHEKRLSAERERYKKNKHLFIAKCAKRKATKLQATPVWSDQSQINSIYQLAKEMSKSTGQLHHVDHVVPLRSKIVCGLHVPANLQIVLKTYNLSKANRYWPDMPE